MKPLRFLIPGGVVAFALVVAQSQATSRGPAGLLVYQAQVGKHQQLFTVGPGAGARQLTHFTNSDSLHAAWSPDGTRIAFERDFAKHAGVFTMNADGSGLRSLTPRGLQGMPSYSPNGKLIAFDRTLPHQDAIWVMNTRGGGLRQVTHNRPAAKNECRCDGSPSFSPDGRRIAFVRTISEHKVALFTVASSGGTLKQLTPWGRGVAAKIDWSPDGSLIVFSSPEFGPGRPGTSANVFTVHPDGTGVTQLTHDRGGKINNGAGSFSPDGTKIAFINNRSGHYQVHVMNVDGTASTPLTTGTDAHWVNWGSHR
jgi:Tol biopolymer transport system component